MGIGDGVFVDIAPHLSSTGESVFADKGIAHVYVGIGRFVQRIHTPYSILYVYTPYDANQPYLALYSTPAPYDYTVVDYTLTSVCARHQNALNTRNIC